MGQEFKPLGKIDLSQFDKYAKKPKAEKLAGFSEYQQGLDKQLKKVAQEINDSYGYFVSDDAAIALDSYPPDFYDRSRAEKYISDTENIFIEKSGLSREAWEKDRETKMGIIAEKVLILLFHKITGGQGNGFITVRSSRFDDYHGIDTVIIDEETGNPICGVDEMSANENHSLENKGEKISDRIISKNGAYIQYGAVIKNGKLEKRVLKNVPAFYLALSQKDLEEVLPFLEGEEASPVEKKIFQRLVLSLEQQLKNLYWEFDGDYNTLKDRREALLLELEEIKKNQTDLALSKTDIGREWKKSMGENNLKLNILHFKKSLAKMKKMAGLE
ncbi:MAG TPA: hypothetical protein PKI61_03870 [bacterium]|nr:hypothetical protein [bacterium]HPT29626.1 hypothetical protein [bacterium]